MWIYICKNSSRFYRYSLKRMKFRTLAQNLHFLCKYDIISIEKQHLLRFSIDTSTGKNNF